MTFLLLADTGGSADMFHAVPVGVPDPFPYLELDDGRRIAVLGANDSSHVAAAVPELDVIEATDLGRDELVVELGMVRVNWELALRACRRFGVTEAVVPPDFPVGAADHLRAGGISLRPDVEAFAARRRVKTQAQLAGVRRAAETANAAMARAAELLRELPPGLTCEGVRAEMAAVCDRHGADLPTDVIVARNEQGARGHDSGSGPLAPGDRVVVDIWPRDRASRCWADMTRTFVAGGAPPGEELSRYWSLSRRALEVTMEAVRPGVSGRAVYDLACEVFEAAGQPTQRSKPAGSVLRDGFYHGLGHGVGLEVHEAPTLGLVGEELVAGDVITLEPGCYRQDFGGCRLEDLFLVTEDGAEALTRFPYDL